MVEKIDRGEQARIDRSKERPKDDAKAKPRESDFGEFFKKSALPPQAQVTQQAGSRQATEQAIKEALKQDERQGERGKKDDDDRDKSKDTGRKDEGQTNLRTDQRVIAKGHTGQDAQGGGAGGSGSFTGGQGMAGERKTLEKALKLGTLKSVPVDLKGSFAKKLAENMKSAEQANQPALSQQVLNKIIQSVKIGLNLKGDKEIQLELSEKYFRGLKLRVTSSEGKVSVALKSGDLKGKEILEKNKEGLVKALKEKGIDVDEVVIT